MHRAGRSFKVQPARVAAVLGVNGRPHAPPAPVHATAPASAAQATGNHLCLASPGANFTQERLIHGSAPARAEDHLESAGVAAPEVAVPPIPPLAPESEGPALDNLKEAVIAAEIKFASVDAAAAEVEAAPVTEVEAALTEAAPVSAAAEVAATVPVAEIITEAKVSDTIVETAPVVETEAEAQSPAEAAEEPAKEAEAPKPSFFQRIKRFFW
ncbi:testis-specific gene A8 protein-like isoform X2 [Penaeus monodon]|uniref:testis-specific gene A8 protein-like isoform X2 n=1 Tax=Penaeus monodon TaxID=6687 RepID=UPI0018A73827|nr:testis-specific gene A8 protein-like isoform X2 [Penaeus monodon]